MVLLLIVFLPVLMAHAGSNQNFVYDAQGKRDPFWPLMSPSGAIVNYAKEDLVVTDMMLEGILAGKNGKNIAIINGNIVEVNAKLGLFVVTQIDFDTVILQKGDESFTLRLKKED